MASNHTPNYNLCQWEPEDQVLRTDFNEDNAKIDAALGSLTSSVGNTAASLQSSLDSLSATVDRHTAALEKKGNCQFYTASFVGDGSFGESYPKSLSFPKKPMVVIIVGPEGEQTFLMQGRTAQYMGRFGVGGAPITVAWSGNRVTWYNQNNPDSQFNGRNKTYHVIALLQTD